MSDYCLKYYYLGLHSTGMNFLNLPEIAGKIMINVPAKILSMQPPTTDNVRTVYVTLSSYIYFAEAAAEHRNMKRFVICRQSPVWQQAVTQWKSFQTVTNSTSLVQSKFC